MAPPTGEKNMKEEEYETLWKRNPPNQIKVAMLIYD